MMLCLASRDFDLSVGSTVAFTGMIAVMVSNATGSIRSAFWRRSPPAASSGSSTAR